MRRKNLFWAARSGVERGGVRETERARERIEADKDKTWEGGKQVQTEKERENEGTPSTLHVF